MEEVLMKSGEKLIFEEGQALENLYMLVSGDISIFKKN